MKRKSVLLLVCSLLITGTPNIVSASELSDGTVEEGNSGEFSSSEEEIIISGNNRSSSNDSATPFAYTVELCPNQVDQVEVSSRYSGGFDAKINSPYVHVDCTGWSITTINGDTRYSYTYDISFDKEGDYTITFVHRSLGSTIDYVAKVVPHTWNTEYTVDKNATCFEDGKKSIRCISCNAIKPYSEIKIPQLEHNYVLVNHIEPSCTEFGEDLYQCQNCWTMHAENFPPLGHTWDKGVVTQQPTCVKEGVKTYTCNTCKTTKTEKLAKTDHKWNKEYTIDKKATCVQEGSKSIHCSVCNGIKPESTVAIPKTEHTWDKGVVTQQPTCVKEGVKTYTCNTCKTTKTEKLAKTDHKYSGKIKKATFIEDGSITGVCSVCGNEKKNGVINRVSEIDISQIKYTYNGKNRQPSVILKDSQGTVLSSDCYTVNYPKESKTPGTYTLTITLKGDKYEGSTTKNYTIQKANQKVAVHDRLVPGKYITSAFKRLDSKTLTLKGVVLQGNKTGKFSFKSDNPSVATVTSWGRITFTGVGTARITATTKGSGNYNPESVTFTLTVLPSPTAITKLQSQKPNWLNIQYRANRKADGYQIQYGTSSDMKGAKYAAVNNSAIRSYTRKDVISGATYYVRVRTFNVVNGKRYYSNWSGIKSMKVQ